MALLLVIEKQGGFNGFDPPNDKYSEIKLLN